MAFVCPTLIETWVPFICNFTIFLRPATGFSDYNVTATFATNPNTAINQIITTNFTQITNEIDYVGNYTVVVFEKNYNAQISQTITVKESNKLNFFLNINNNLTYLILKMKKS